MADSLLQRIGRRFSDEDQILVMDYLLLILGLVSLGIFFVAWNIQLAPAEAEIVRYLDMATQVLFGLGFVGKVLASQERVRTLTNRSPELLGLLPLTQPFLIDPQWFPVQQVLVVLTRLSIGLDRHLGERALYRIFQRYKSAVVEELTDPILIQATVVTQDVLNKGSYARSIGSNLDERRPEIRTLVHRNLQEDRRYQQLARIPGMARLVQQAIDAAVDAAVDATVETLTSEEMDRIVKTTLDQVFEDFREEVARSEWKAEGVGVGDVAGVFRGRSEPGDTGEEMEEGP